MTHLITKLKGWLNQHPKTKATLVVAEATAVTYSVSAVQSGQIVLTKQGLHTFTIGLVGAMYLAVKNYLSTTAKMPITPQD